MPQYYTLDEAARALGTTPENLKKMADRGEVRVFRDRGTMRFRGPEIDELARQRGLGSDPELKLGETAPSRAVDPPTPKKSDDDVFDFELPPEGDDLVEIGQELVLDEPPSKKGPKSSGKRKGSGDPKSSPPKSSPPKPRKSALAKSPPPLKKGSDSDVRLVPDDKDLDFQVANDSDVKIVEDPGPKSSSKLAKPKPKSRLDSGVKIVEDTNADSDVKIVEDSTDSEVSLGGPKKKKSSSDSDIRIEPSGTGRKSRVRIDPSEAPDETMLTEDIDLDAELESAEQQLPVPQSPPKKGGQQPALPTSSPFELSEADLDLPVDPEATVVGDSDIELTPSMDSSSPLEDDDEVSLGEVTSGSGESGINLQDPADSGISLEQAGSDDEIEFELSLESSATPKPAKKEPEMPPDSSGDFDLELSDDSSSSAEDSSPDDSGFELSLDDSSGEQDALPSAEDSDSEFELSLDSDAELQPAQDSDSEFELTLDDSGESDAVEDSGAGDDEKDIFETDFEVPALEEESGSEAIALDESDTDLESSDFDLALDDSDSAPEDESGSQVVALDDEGDVDEGAETVAKPRTRGKPVLEDESDSEDVEDLFDVGEGEGEGEPEASDDDDDSSLGAPAQTPAKWGVLPGLMMLPTVVVLVVVMLMGYELVRSMRGYSTPSPLVRAIADSVMPGEIKDK